MKCPFLVKRKEIFDRDGKHIGEEIEIKDCIKNECMVYDGAAKLCSLLSTNIKNGIIIEDFKNGIKEIKEEMFQRSEAIGVIISTTIQTMQEALLGRFDVLKKQNEVIALGFDRLSEIQANLTDILKNATKEIGEQLNNLLATANSQTDITKSLQEISEKIFQGQNNVNEGIKILFDDVKGSLGKLIDTLDNKIESLKSEFGKLVTTYQIGIETINGEIGKSSMITQEILKKFENFDNLINSVNGISDLIKSEIGGIKNETVGSLGVLSGKLDEFKVLFNETLKAQRGDLQEMNDRIRELINIITVRLEEFKTSITNLTGVYKEDFQTILQRLQTIGDTMPVKLDELGNSVRNELGIFKNELITIMGNLQNDLNKFADFFKEFPNSLGRLTESLEAANRNYLEALGRLATLSDSARVNMEKIGEDIKNRFDEFSGALKSGLDVVEKTHSHIASMNEMMNNLNRNYLESLGKIAGLAEGMRKGVESVGENMQGAVKELISEMKNEIGALEEQYQKTFGDVARLAEKFEQLNNRIGNMTEEIQNRFRETLAKQVELSGVSGDILSQIKEYFAKEEERYNQEAIAKKKKEALDHFDRATLYYYRGSYELALSEIEKALEIEKLAEYLNLKGLILTELGREEEAKGAYEEALKLEPNLAEIYNNLGLLYIKTKKLNEAVSSFQQAIKRNVNYCLAYVHLGKALIELERFDEAIEAFEHALKIDPTNKEAKEAIEFYKQGKIG
uniref:Tetratricopeptide repeat protein n=1 Tax=candidate division WOR-3 bacterium TaxID=2052148 RepID=A0A7C4TG23_UNCW3